MRINPLARLFAIIAFTVMPAVVAFSAQPKIYYLGEQRIENQMYFVELQVWPNEAVVWLRARPYTCSLDDKKVLTLSIGYKTIYEVQTQVCRARKIYDNGKIIVGCGSLVGTGICAFTGAGGGYGAVVCYATATYALTTGAQDCIFGLAGIIAQLLGYGQEWQFVKYQYGISSPKLTTLIDLALDAMCQDLQANKNY